MRVVFCFEDDGGLLIMFQPEDAESSGIHISAEQLSMDGLQRTSVRAQVEASLREDGVDLEVVVAERAAFLMEAEGLFGVDNVAAMEGESAIVMLGRLG